jgi:glucokinase
MKHFIAVDVGGTHIRAALYPETGIHPLKQERTTTRHHGEKPEDRIIKLIEKVMPDDGQLTAIGIAAPGPLDPKTGIVITASNIPGWHNFPLRQIISDRFIVPVALGNDANLAAYGEWKYGAGQGHHNLIYLTISTGIGGGVICNDQLLLGERGLAAELGHVMIWPEGPVCSCGQRGHLEAISSGTGIANFVIDELAKGTPSVINKNPPPTSKEINLAAHKGDPLAIKAYHQAGTYLGMALANYLHIFNPTIIICGGGVSMSGELLFGPTREAITRYTLIPEYTNDLLLKTAGLGDDAGIVGALALARSLVEG